MVPAKAAASAQQGLLWQRQQWRQRARCLSQWPAGGASCLPPLAGQRAAPGLHAVAAGTGAPEQPGQLCCAARVPQCQQRARCLSQWPAGRASLLVSAFKSASCGRCARCSGWRWISMRPGQHCGPVSAVCSRSASTSSSTPVPRSEAGWICILLVSAERHRASCCHDAPLGIGPAGHLTSQIVPLKARVLVGAPELQH